MRDATPEYCTEMILKYEPTETGRNQRYLGVDGKFIAI